MSDKGDYRRAPATPGLLNILYITVQWCAQCGNPCTLGSLGKSNNPCALGSLGKSNNPCALGSLGKSNDQIPFGKEPAIFHKRPKSHGEWR